MSRNFELLRRADWRQEIFEGLPSAPLDEPSPTHTKPFSARNDRISMLVRRVFLDSRPSRIRAVMFTGITRRVGCTWTCAQTAKTLADSITGNVCVVDANFEAPTLHGHFSEGMRPGLSDAVLTSKRVTEFLDRVGDSNLWLLTAGIQGRQARSLASGAILQCLRELRSHFDYLLIDGPSLASGPHAFSIGRAGDGAALVLGSSGIAPNLLLSAKKQMERARVPLFGVVLNQFESALPPLLDRLMT